MQAARLSKWMADMWQGRGQAILQYVLEVHTADPASTQVARHDGGAELQQERSSGGCAPTRHAADEWPHGAQHADLGGCEALGLPQDAQVGQQEHDGGILQHGGWWAGSGSRSGGGNGRAGAELAAQTCPATRLT